MIRAVVFDWAGTVVDHGSLAPMGAFVRAFAEFGVPISIADARGPMGSAKRDHIKAVGALPHVAAGWRAAQGSEFDDTAIDRIFAVFEPMNVASVSAHAALIPGAAETLAWCAARNIRIGATTGYTRPIMAVLAPLAAAQGFTPEITICAGDMAAGRPAPLQMWQVMATMGVHPAHAVVKVDDTPVGIGEGRTAGTWAIGLALTGNMAGLTLEDLTALDAAETAALRARASAPLFAAGAHLVIDGIADLPAAIELLEARIAAGERPGAFG
ncbi:phosphonoacetaldehyde hydrolase [Humitalea rosea]|uniref:Phosphonoacetaldehyde hydrolase n=1 Tax=Humitalea rosea TaxID=990373 RepID=A0A2W7IM19_9PROT|nr:phosphonoacetaldehyde hydrolase [Humitalea rosea]PZW48142.1 phosphonoacetaldehyde hydrolase [Humitalea rosea]